MTTSPKTLYLIDGSGFIFRAYHALPPLTDPSGTPVGAVYGFVNMLMKLLEGHTSDYFAVVFDAGRKTFRNDIYSEYKANRPPAPEDLIPQFAIVREATRALNLPCIELADFEADDIIATYATQACKTDMNVTIVSSDKDLMQLVNDCVRMYDAMKQKYIHAPEVMEKFGVGPDKVLDVLSLMGDSSDNVPGVPGIGPKTAAELINIYGDLDTLLARAGEIKQQKRRETILQNTDQAKLSRELIKLRHDVPGLLPVEELHYKEPEPAVLLEFVRKYGFKSLALKLEAKFHGISSLPPFEGEKAKSATTPQVPAQAAPLAVPAAVPKNYTLVRDEKTLAGWIARATEKAVVAFDTETTGLNALQAEMVGFSLCIEPGEACYVPLQHMGLVDGHVGLAETGDLFAPPPKTKSLLPNQIPLARAVELLKPLLENASVLKIGHNIKYDMHIVEQYGIEVSPIEDTMLLSYVLYAGEHGHGMDELSERYLRYTPISYDQITGTGKNRIRFDEVDVQKACDYAAEDADVTLRLHQVFKPQLFAKKMISVYETIERPLVPVLSRMESAGIKVDVKQLAALSGDFSTRMAEYEKEIHRLAGMEFNVGSPKQLGEVLFEKMGLEGGKKSSKTGAYSTGSDVLEELAEQGHELPRKIIEWRQLSKLKSTYSDSLPEEINPKTGRIHTSFAQAIASTGRLSSNEPNLQNIPIRTVEGKKIREAFIAEDGYLLVSADYSQIELRLLAHVADIPTLKEAFKNGDDIHAITASQMFGVPLAEVGADLRRSAKMINFGIIYGISAHGLSTRLGIGRAEAGEYIGQYFQQYPGIRDYMESSKEFGRKHGYVVTLFDRRIHLPGINSKGPMRAFSERQAINAPLQGTAADIIKRAMITLDRELAAMPETRMLLQVHDELVFEVKEGEEARIEALAKRHMEQAANLSVPLVVETGSGKHWGDAH